MDGRSRATRAVAARRGELGMTQADLAAKASVNVKTIGNLESRGRWPTAATRARIETALGWPLGTMADIAASPDPEDERTLSAEGLEEKHRQVEAALEAALAQLRGNGHPKSA